MKLFGQLGNFNTNKVLAVAEFTSQTLNFEQVQNVKDKEFLNLSPLGKIPVLQTTQGEITSSNAAIKYLSNISSKLNGSSDFEKAQIDSFLNFTSQELEPVLNQIVGPLFGQVKLDQSMNTKAQNDLRSLLNYVNEHLKTRTVLVGQKISIADISMASALTNAFKLVFDEKFRTPFLNLTRWFTFISGQDQFQNVWGKVRLCVEPLITSDAPKENKEAPKKVEAKKVEAPKKPAPKEDLEDEAPMTKQKNPLDLLPETKFILYDFKTLIVNAPNKKDAIQFLWDNFDQQGFSFWKIEYEKYEGEGEKLYMTRNMANGFLQRLEGFNKYCFGTWGVYGDEPNLEIRGLFMWRGLEKPFEITDHQSYEYHKFTKLEFNDPKTRELVTEYWTNLTPETKVEGLVAQSVQYYK